MQATSAASAAPEISTLFSGIRVGEKARSGAVTFVPLFKDEPSGLDADLLEESLASGTSRVSELHESGTVNSIRVEHSGRRVLLIVDGEQVLGAKQNRVFNASFLVPPGASVVVPVSCVERGRWACSGERSAKELEFSASERTLAGSGRSRKLSRVVTSTFTGRGYDADQREVWRDVDTYLEKTSVRSTTAAYDDGYRSRAAEVEARLASAAPRPGQIGLAAVAGGKLVGMDVFGSPALYARAWKKIARGVLADVYDGPPDAQEPENVVTSALQKLTAVSVTRTAAPGCGESLHGATGGLVVGAIALQGAVVHAFVAQP